MDRRRVYGLDIETDQTLDPSVGGVRTVVLSTAGRDQIFDGPERTLLTDLDDYLKSLDPGLLATWNGGGFDLPFLADRASVFGLTLGLVLAADPKIALQGEPLRGHRCAYRGAWYEHRHIDASRMYRSGRGRLVEVTDLLASFGRRHTPRRPGLGLPIDADLSHEVVHAFPRSDARLARVLVERRLPHVSRFVDRIVKPEPAGAVGAGRSSAVRQPDFSLRSPNRPPLSPAHPAVRASLAAQQ